MICTATQTTRQTIKALLDSGLWQALADGKTVEQRWKSADDQPYNWKPWEGSITILFDDSWEVRIKPEPQEFWIGMCPTQSARKVFDSNREAVQACDCELCKVVHVREVEGGTDDR